MDALAPRALVFDLDGTVWDSYPWIARVVADGSAEAHQRALASLRDKTSVVKLLHDCGITRTRFRSICAEAEDLKPYPNVPETLGALFDGGLPLGVVTNLPEWVASPMLDCLGLRPFFASVVEYSRTRPAKPHPAPILASLDELGIDPAPDVWYVGDTDSDGEAAARASVSFAWASYGYGTTEPSNSAAVFTDFSEVLAL